MPNEFRQALEISKQDGSSLHLALQKTIGVDHALVGGMLVEKWRFAPNLVETIQNMHGPVLKDTPMVASVFAANQIAKKLNFGFGGNCHVDELTLPMAQRLGGNLDDLIARLGDLDALFEEAKIFSQLES
jgi:hypothetical protein